MNVLLCYDVFFSWLFFTVLFFSLCYLDARPSKWLKRYFENQVWNQKPKIFLKFYLRGYRAN